MADQLKTGLGADYVIRYKDMTTYFAPTFSALCEGPVADNATVIPNATMVGGKALSANPTTATTGRLMSLMMTLVGAAVVKPYSIPDTDWQFTSAGLTTTTAVAAKAAGAAGIRNYVTGISFQNTAATASTLLIQDGAATVWQVSLPASMATPIWVAFPTPIRGTAATALNVNCGTAGANIIVNVQGYQAP